MFDFTLLSAISIGIASMASAGLIWFGIFTVILLFGFIASAYEDEPAIWLLPFILLAAIWWNFTNPFMWLWVNPIVVIKFAVQYLLIGFIYATFRWWRVIFSAGQDIAANKVKLLERFHNNTYGYNTFEDFLAGDGRIPYVSKHKAALTRWTLTWFFSAPGFFFNDFFKFLGDFITTFFGGFFTRMRHWTFERLGIDDALLNTARVAPTSVKREVKDN